MKITATILSREIADGRLSWFDNRVFKEAFKVTNVEISTKEILSMVRAPLLR